MNDLPRMTIKEFAKYLRDNATKSEKKLHKKLNETGIKFRFQHIIKPFIVDFYFSKGKRIIELDGKRFHNKIKDASRDLYLSNAGYKIHRIKSYRCFRDMDNVIQEIKYFLSGKDMSQAKRSRKKPKS